MVRRSVATAVVVGLLTPSIPTLAADVILNEYNAVSNTNLLKNGNSDVFWGRRAGNGQDWFELVVVTDHVDMRGWELLVVNDVGGLTEESWSIALTSADVWADVRSGTIITVSEDLGNNVGDYNPVVGQWWINVRAAAGTSGTYATVTCVSPACLPQDVNWRVTNDNWQITIKDDLGTVVFGPAGEGVFPLSGIGSDEVFKLEEDPSGSITPTSNYRDGTSSTFGQPNVYDAGATTQDLSNLRSVVPFTQLTSVRLNEVFAHSDPAVDWVELYNTTAAPIDIGGWYLSDSFTSLQKYEIPAATTIPAGGYLVFDETTLGFAFDAGCGDEVILSVGDGLGGLTGERDHAELGAVENGVAFGRSPNGSGNFTRLATATQGAANASPLIPPVVISEVMYHPPDPAPGVTVDPEYVELHNTTAAPVDLFTDFGAAGTFPWRLTGGIDFDFSLTTTIPAQGYLVVVNFDPAVDTVQLDEFRTIYGIDTSVTIVGPYTGKLGNFSDTVRLRKPDTPEPGPDCNGNPVAFAPQVVVEELTYFDFGAWPTGPDGGGASLERTTPLAVAGDPTSWLANPFPSPGSATCGNSTVEGGETCDDGNQEDGDCCSSSCQLDASGTTCDDGAGCTIDDACDGAGTCSGLAEPEPACLTAITNILLIKNRDPDSRDRLVWKWTRGEETLYTDFADPTQSGTTYYLCGYDESASVPTPIFDVTIPGASSCGTRPCWLAASGGVKGYRYRDGDETVGGIALILLKPGIDGKAKIILKAKDINLSPPDLPLAQDPGVILQLKNSAGGCWGVDFETPALKNEDEQFKVKQIN